MVDKEFLERKTRNFDKEPLTQAEKNILSEMPRGLRRWRYVEDLKQETASQMQDFLEKSLESKNRFEGDLEDCLHNGSWGDGCWVVDVDGDKSYIKCGDCNKIFDSGSELSLDVIKKIRDALKKKWIK